MRKGLIAADRAGAARRGLRARPRRLQHPARQRAQGVRHRLRAQRHRRRRARHRRRSGDRRHDGAARVRPPRHLRAHAGRAAASRSRCSSTPPRDGRSLRYSRAGDEPDRGDAGAQRRRRRSTTRSTSTTAALLVYAQHGPKRVPVSMRVTTGFNGFKVETSRRTFHGPGLSALQAAPRVDDDLLRRLHHGRVLGHGGGGGSGWRRFSSSAGGSSKPASSRSSPRCCSRSRPCATTCPATRRSASLNDFLAFFWTEGIVALALDRALDRVLRPPAPRDRRRRKSRLIRS